ncbi:hypothetical protein [Nonomuraea jabiensis]|uniref:hypothetical protein n=1 Tax=Nonomuraea jabiensis TaxID=882448 RepID=UPI003D750E09
MKELTVALHRYAARRLGADIGKRHRREPARYRAYARGGLDPAELGGGRVEDGVATLAVNRPLVAAPARLRTGDRDALLLVAWVGLTYEEVAVAQTVIRAYAAGSPS